MKTGEQNDSVGATTEASLVEDVVKSTFTGAFTGYLLDSIFKNACSIFSIQLPSSADPNFLAFGGYRPLVQSLVAGSGLDQACNFAMVYGVDAGISCAMKKIRGKEDVETSMAAGFGSGVMLSLVTGMRGPEVLSVGVMFALLKGGFFKIDKRLSHVKAEGVCHDNTRGTFSCIGFGLDYGLFADNTLSMFTDRKDAKKGCRRTCSRS